MPLILKAGKTITNPQTGDAFSTVVAVVNHVENTQDQQSQIVKVKMFLSSSHIGRQEMQHPLAGEDYQATGQDWLDFFAEDKIEPAGKTMYTQAYDWLLTVTEEESRALIWGDWELS